jgi:hypothetical protein
VTAHHGKYSPFGDMYLAAHLGLHELESFQFHDDKLGEWVTLLRNSPPLTIWPNSTLHFKFMDVKVNREAIVQPTGSLSTPHSTQTFVDLPGSDLSMPLVMKRDTDEGSDGDVIDNSGSPNSRLPLPQVSLVGTQPSTLSKFPAKTKGKMDVRFHWINDNTELGTREERFNMVFTCDFVSSTYFKHQKVWKQLCDKGVIDKIPDTDSWATCMSRHGKCSTIPPEVLDLTQDGGVTRTRHRAGPVIRERYRVSQLTLSRASSLNPPIFEVD